MARTVAKTSHPLPASRSVAKRPIPALALVIRTTGTQRTVFAAGWARQRAAGRPNPFLDPDDGQGTHAGRYDRAMPTLFEHAGGEEALHRLEQLFYDSVLRDPLLQPLFGDGQPEHVDHLTMFTAETFGGPDRFTRELGFQHLIDVHRGLEITEEQRERFVELYMAALDAAVMPDDEPFRAAVREHVEFGARVAMQNSHAKTDAELHPLREVPRWAWSGGGT
jgi:hemoglobin